MLAGFLAAFFFVAKVEVWGDGVFEKVDEEIADQHVEESAFAGEVHGFGDDVDEGDAKHVAGAEGQKILQIFAGPVFVNDEIAAEQISARGYQAEGSSESGARG